MTQDEVMQARAQAQIYASQDELRRKGLELYPVLSGSRKPCKRPERRQKELSRMTKELERAMSRFNTSKIRQEMLDDKGILESALTQYNI